MENQCQFPGCSRFAQKNGYCIGHRIYSNVPPEEKKKALPGKRSEKMKEEMKLYKPQVKAYLARPENEFCKINSPVCTGKAECVNHKKRRGGNLRDERYFEPACGPCNNYIEANTQWALDNGHLIPVHQKEKNA